MSSEKDDFNDMLYKFALRLLNRGYLPSTYRRIFKLVRWIDRTRHREIRPPKTGIPLIFRFQFRNNDVEGRVLLKIITKYWNLLPPCFKDTRPLICWTVQRKLWLFATKADHQSLMIMMTI